jgi:hypothetical protein
MKNKHYKMNSESVPDSSQALFNARLTNIEYGQIPVDRELLKNMSLVIDLLQPRVSKMPLFRLGARGDGGYVLAPAFESKICLNLGVGFEVSADLDLLGRGFKIYAIDGTVSNPFPKENGYTFIRKNVGYDRSNELTTDLHSIFRQHSDLSQVDLILIDIEGWEYKVLHEELDLIAKSKQIVIEFHGLELIGDSQFNDRFKSILKKLSKTHLPVHVHANNSGGGLPIGGANWPTILEVTFLVNELCTSEINYGPFPSDIDFPNVDLRPDIDLSPLFGKNKNYASLARTILDLH